MDDKVGRNDPCPCGSGKKYKQCCLLEKQKASAPRGLKKFTAKVISSGGKAKPEPEQAPEGHQTLMNKAAFDYNTLMERSFGTGIHAKEAPPLPSNPSDYLVKEDPKKS